MKMAFLMWQHSTFPEDFPKGALGGAESATWYLANELSDRHDVEIMCRGVEDRTQVIGKVALIRIASPMPSKWIQGDYYYKRAMDFASDRDLIVAITCIEPAFYSDNVALHLENELSPYLPFPKAKARFYIAEMERFRCISGVSRYVSKRFVKAFNYGGRITTILNGADCKEFSPAKGDRPYLDRFGVSENDISIVYAGAIHRRKGLHLLLDALDSINKPEARLLILGGLIYSKKRSGDVSYLKEQLEKIRSLPQITFVGPVSKPVMARILASSDIFVCPSIWEDPCPLVCAEAQASGIPVIGFRRGGIPELVEHGKTGLIVEPNVEELASSLTKLCEDVKLRRTMGRKARRRAVDILNWKIIARRLESFLSK